MTKVRTFATLREIATDMRGLAKAITSIRATDTLVRVVELDDQGPVDIVLTVCRFANDAALERQREGMAKAKAAGKYKGSQPTPPALVATIAKMKADGETTAKIAEALGISRRSVFRALAKAE